jgi:hypothetical protein
MGNARQQPQPERNRVLLEGVDLTPGFDIQPILTIIQPQSSTDPQLCDAVQQPVQSVNFVFRRHDIQRRHTGRADVANRADRRERLGGAQVPIRPQVRFGQSPRLSERVIWD